MDVILYMLVRKLKLSITSDVFFPGNLQGTHISLDDQLQNHQKVIKAIVGLVGEAKAMQLLNSCLYTVGMGSNDYINNYFLRGSSASQNTPEQYATLLIDQYSSQLKVTKNHMHSLIQHCYSVVIRESFFFLVCS